MRTSRYLLLAASAALAGCGPPAPTVSEFEVRAIPARVAVSPEQVDQLSAAAFQVNRQLNLVGDIFDESNPKSELNKINRVAGAHRLRVAFNAFRAIDLAHYYSQVSGGAFDIAAGPLYRAWGLKGALVEEEPEEDELRALRELTGPRIIQLTEQGDISILMQGAELAVGDLPYAYGVDLAALELRRRGIAPAFVEWEDYARAVPGAFAAVTSRRRIPDPFTTNAAALGELDLSPDAAFALVRLWERSGQVGARKIPGIINPLTGHPAEGTALVAVRGPTCTQAHALAMALLVKGLETGAELLPAFEEYEVLLVPDRQPLEIWTTAGMAERLTLRATLTNSLRRWERPAAPANATNAPTELAPSD